MKRMLAFLLAGGLLCGATPLALAAEAKRITMLSAFDLDGEAADPNQVIEAVAIVDNGTSVAAANYTIVAQPDSCRLHGLTLVDTDLSAGTLTVAGLDCLGASKSCSFAFTAGDDTGVKTMTCTDGESAYFSSVTAVTTGTMTGESDETFALGYTSNSAIGWATYGKLVQGKVDIEGFYTSVLKATTSGAISTTVTAVSSNAAFADVVAGDLLFFTWAGENYERLVTAKASSNSITVNQAIRLPSDGVPFLFKHRYFSTNPYDLVGVVNVDGWDTVSFTWAVDANANTGGVVTSLQCTADRGPEWPINHWVEPRDTTRTDNPTTTPSGSTQAAVMESIDLTLANFSYCRFGIYFGTGDDADAAAEDINLVLALTK